MHPRLIPCLAIAALAVAPALHAADAAPAPAPTYTVNLSPANKVGGKFGYVSDLAIYSHSDTTISAPAMPAPQNQVQDKEVIVHLEADGEVLAVYPNGGIQKVALMVKSFKATQGGQSLPNAPAAGAKIVAERTDAGKLNITIGDKPAGTALSALLAQISPLNDGKYADQDVFGSKTPVAVGASWPVNSDLFMQSFKSTLGSITGVNGSTKLVSIKGKGDDQEATISGTFTVDGVKAPLPPTIIADPVEFSAEISAVVPATTAKGTAKHSMNASMKFSASGNANGADIKISATQEQKNSKTYTYQ